ncbi:hypothetical protein SCG7086_BM_00040 [Chlamydiales bacterium SCGC AG-110-P3]|nr:hypothetical protein SCG7086_BM_00040 [Chlamydiales bacterium SCGC AG-110-P3]
MKTNRVNLGLIKVLEEYKCSSSDDKSKIDDAIKLLVNNRTNATYSKIKHLKGLVSILKETEASLKKTSGKINDLSNKSVLKKVGSKRKRGSEKFSEVRISRGGNLSSAAKRARRDFSSSNTTDLVEVRNNDNNSVAYLTKDLYRSINPPPNAKITFLTNNTAMTEVPPSNATETPTGGTRSVYGQFLDHLELNSSEGGFTGAVSGLLTNLLPDTKYTESESFVGKEEKEYYPPIAPILLSSVKNITGDETSVNATKLDRLLDHYDKLGESWKEYYKKPLLNNKLYKRRYIQQVVNDAREAFVQIAQAQQTSAVDNSTMLLERMIVPSDTEVIKVGDLHGDAYSLVQILRKLQEDGKLDENYQVTKEEEIQIVFLGDYVDRGPDSWAVLDILSRLKLNNMNNVHLIRGNHENMDVINSEAETQGFWNQKKEEDCELTTFFKLLPQAVFLGFETSLGEVEYDISTHGGIPISFDLNKLHQKGDGLHLFKKGDAAHQIDVRNNLPGDLRDLSERISSVMQDYLSDSPEINSRITAGLWDWADSTVDLNKSGFRGSGRVKINVYHYALWAKYLKEVTSKLSLDQIDQQDHTNSTESATNEKTSSLRVRRITKGHSHEKGYLLGYAQQESDTQGNFSEDSLLCIHLDSDLFWKDPSDICCYTLNDEIDAIRLLRRNYGEIKWDSSCQLQELEI